STLLDKAEELSEKAWDKGGEALDKFGDVAENVGEKVISKGKDLVEKAKHALDNPQETVDSISDKLKDVDKKLKDAVSGNAGDRYADTPITESLNKQGSLLKDKDDFFSKAEKFAEGNYSMKEEKLELKPLSEEDLKKAKQGNVKGFEDNDGDGDEIIDDAILDEDDQPKKED
ncbi:MAG TPA: hypothetical protein PK643_21545, partial [Saprospiraceae bacterium]|nr:hypothetical protein [Saprospiraceae bacterium]